jgi:Na+/H+-dicarboxylate symporter
MFFARARPKPVGKIILGVLKTIVTFFGVEIISMVIGILLTKSINSAVYNLTGNGICSAVLARHCGRSRISWERSRLPLIR